MISQLHILPLSFNSFNELADTQYFLPSVPLILNIEAIFAATVVYFHNTKLLKRKIAPVHVLL